LFVVAAVSLFAVVWPRRRTAPPLLIAGNGKTPMMSLMDAAKSAYEIARRERMVIVTVAERAPEDGAIGWFARSIAGVLPIYRSGHAGNFEKLAKASVTAELQSLYIRKRDYQTYVRWARSMQ
jgi:ferredoxin-NADP reductase